MKDCYLKFFLRSTMLHVSRLAQTRYRYMYRFHPSNFSKKARQYLLNLSIIAKLHRTKRTRVMEVLGKAFSKEYSS